MAKMARARSEAEYKKVANNLKRMYPEMYKAMQKGETRWKKTPRKKTLKRTGQVSRSLRSAGMSDKDIAKLRD